MPTYEEIPKDNINENLADSYLGEIADVALSTLVGSGVSEPGTLGVASFLDSEPPLAPANSDELIIAQGDFLSASLTTPVTEETSQLNNTDPFDPITGTKKSENLVPVTTPEKSEIEKEPLLNPGATVIESPINRATQALDVVKAYNKINPALLKLNIESGFFVVDETGNVSLDYVFDGGFYKGELAIFSLGGMETLIPGSPEFISEAASRALSHSELGHIVISDRTQGARFNGELGEANFNSGEYRGVTTFAMTPGDVFAIMLVPNGTVQDVFDNPAITGSKRPLFSLVTANPNQAFHLGQIADVTGEGHTFVMEDYRVDKWTDGDYNDIIFQITGAIGQTVHLDEVINPKKDWRGTEFGQSVLAYIEANAPILTSIKPERSSEENLTQAITSQQPEIAAEAPGNAPDFENPQILPETLPAAIATDADETDSIITTSAATSEAIASEESEPALPSIIPLVGEVENPNPARFESSPTTISSPLDSPPELENSSDISLRVDSPSESENFSDISLRIDSPPTAINEAALIEASAPITGENSPDNLSPQLIDNAVPVTSLSSPLVSTEPSLPDPIPTLPDSLSAAVTLSEREDKESEPVLIEDSETSQITTTPEKSELSDDKTSLSDSILTAEERADSPLLNTSPDSDSTSSLSNQPDEIDEIAAEIAANKPISETSPATGSILTDATVTVPEKSDAVDPKTAPEELTPGIVTPAKITPIPFNSTEAPEKANISSINSQKEDSPATLSSDGNNQVISSNSPSPTALTSNNNSPVTPEVSPEANKPVSTTISQLATSPSNITPDTSTESTPLFTSGVFTVGSSGEVKINYLYDGGLYNSEVGIFSLQGLEDYLTDKSELFKEVARRVLKDSPESGYVVISDAIDAAQFSGILGSEPKSWNSGINEGTKTFPMQPGEKFGIIVVPNGTIQEVFNNPNVGGNKHPLLSIVTDDPKDIFHGRQLADATGDECVIAVEDLRLEVWSDKDYNDIIFNIVGATGTLTPLSEVIAPDKDWQSQSLWQEILDSIDCQTSEDTTAPSLTADIAFDTGVSNTDRLTNNPTLNGTVTDDSAIAHLFASFNNQLINFEITSHLAEDGRFTLTPEILAAINTGELPDGNYTLYLQAIDINGNASPIKEVPFTLDTTPPPISLDLAQASDSSPIGDNQTELATVTLVGQTEPNLTVTLKETGVTTTADNSGHFQFSDISLNLGNNSFTVETIDSAGNQNQEAISIARIQETAPDLTLIENSHFTVKENQTLTIPSTPSYLTFSISNIAFDSTDTDFINDAFEVALVDNEGNSLVHTIGTGKDAFFNWTEGESVQLGAGASYSATAQTVTLNLTGITPGIEANLVFRLVNDDSDTTTGVSLKNIAIIDAPEDPLPPVQTRFDSNTIAPPLSAAELAKLSDISSSFKAEYHTTSFKADTDTLFADIAIRNIGGYGVDSPLLVAIANISDPTVVLRNPDGITPEGIPYYNFSDLVVDGKLDPNEVTNTGSLEFYNPNGGQFSYELIVLGQLNQNPIIETKPLLEVISGKVYNYDIDATDKDGDRLTYKPVVVPEGMTIDPDTGLISWDTSVDRVDIGNYSIKIEVSDNRGGVAFQEYILQVIETPPNRPPIYTSTPIVDAYINQLYRYNSEAIDPDNNTLTHSLILGPEGMKVNPVTGEIEWTPPAVVILGDTVLGRINLPGEKDEFTISGTEGQRLYFDSLQYSGNYWDWKFEVYSPSGLKVLDTTLLNNQLLNLTETGNYRVVVDANGDITGTYGFSVLDLGMVPVVAFDTAINGLLSPGKEDDVFRFTGNAGQKLYFDRLSNETNLDWIIYDASGKQIYPYTSWDDKELELPTDGEYILALRGAANFTSSVPYSFKIITPDIIAQPLIPGSNNNPNTINASLSEKGEQDIYTFDGTTGQRLYFDILKANPDWVYNATLLSPSGVKLFDHNLTLGDYSKPFNLNETGTYSLTIDATGENTGDYSFNLLDVGSSTPINKDKEYNSTLAPGNETHLYSFTVAETSQRLYLDSLINSPGASWTLYGPNNERVATDNTTASSDVAVGSQNGNGTGLSNDFEVTLTLGTYLLAIQGNNPSNPVDYKFQVITPETSRETLTPDYKGTLNVSGSISEKGERDIYTFEGTANQWLFPDSLVETPNTYVRLISPSGVEVFNNTSIAYDYYRNPVILPEGGTYKLIVDGYGESTDNYNLRLVSLTDATQLIPGANPTQGILNPGSKVDVYAISGTAGDRLYVDAQATGVGNSAAVILYNPLFPQSIASAGTLGDIETVLPGDGTYYLMVRGDGDSNSTIPYSIRAISTLVSSTNLQIGTPVNHSISQPGEQDLYTFNVTAPGQRVVFDGISGTNIIAKLESPSGQLIFSNQSISYDSNPFALTETGTYRLTVDAYNDSTGNYSFNLAAAPFNPVTRPYNAELTLSTVPSTVALNAGTGTTYTYKFDGEVGQKLLYDDLNSSNPNAAVTLISPLGTAIYNSNAVYDSSLITLQESGTYYLQFTNQSAAANSVNFRLLDSETGATPLTLGDNKSGNLSNSYGVDLYRFNVNEPNQYLYLDAASGNWPNYWTLYGPGGQNIGNNPAIYSDFEMPLPSTGEYILALNGTGVSPNYNFQLIPSPILPSSNFQVGEEVSGDIALKGERDYFEFEGTALQRLFFDGIAGNNINARLVSPSGQQIFEIGVASDKDPYVLQETGTYRLTIDGNYDATGTYRFRFLDLDASLSDIKPTPIVSLNAPTALSVDANKVELVNFNGEAGQYVYFLNNYTGPWSSWTIYGPGNQRLNQDGTTWTYSGSDRELALPTDGTYTLALAGAGSGTTNYQFERVTPSLPSGEMTIGTSVAGTLENMGQKNTYQFEGQLGQQLLLDSEKGLSGLRIKIYSPSGTEVYNRNTTEEIAPFTLQESGLYRVVVDGDSRTTGNYSFRLLDLASSTHPSVKELPFDTNISATLSRSEERQAYRFVGTKGQHLYFDKNENWNGSNGTNWALYGPGNQLLANPPWWSPDIELELPGDGTYSLVVGGNANNVNAESYQFQVVTPQTSTKTLLLGDPISEKIGEAGEKDIYTFSGMSGNRLFFDSLIGNSNITTKLYSPSGAEVFLNNGGRDTATDSSDPFFLQETGEYRLVIDGNNDITGDYSFRLLDVEAVPNATFDESISNTIAPGKEIDFYQFKGTAGQQLYFDLTEPSWNSANWVLYGPGNQKVASPAWYDPDIDVTLKTSGTYVLAISGNSSTPIDYNFSIVTPTTTTNSLVLGTEVSNALSEAGEKDEYAFDGTIGQQLFFDGLSGSNSIRLKLFSPAGVEVINTITSNDGAPFSLTESGTYRLVVDGDNNATGNYSFNLSDRADATPLSLTTPNLGTAAEKSVDLYQFIGKPGQILNFNLDAATWSNGGSWVLYDPNNQPLAIPAWYSPDFKATLPSAGLYTLAVANSSSAPINYNFQVTDNTPAPVTNAGLVTVSGTLTAGGTKEHKFTASAGTKIILDSLNNTNSQIYSRLIAPDGSYVFNYQDSRYNTSPIVLSQTGEYTLQIYGYYSSSAGDYKFNLLELPSNLRAPGTHYLELGGVVSGISSETAAKVYTFEGVEGLRLAFNGITGNNVGATLYNPNGQVVFSKGNFQSSDTQPFTLTQNGLYQLVVEAEIAGNRDYSFQLLELSTAPDLTFNLPVSGSLNSGTQSQFYKFNGSAGERFFFDSISGTTSNYWKLIGPNNQPLYNYYLNQDFEIELPQTGEYALLIEGGTSPAPVNYSFRVFPYAEVTPDILVPGTGEMGSNSDGSIGLFPVKLSVEDGFGGTDIQEYNIRAWPDPDNSNPVIVSAPKTRFALDNEIYQYQLSSLDPDGDRLKYRLINSPLGALIDGDTGELLWFPEKTAKSGDKVQFTVEVSDGRGGTNTQDFTVDIYGSLGKIQGAVFDDLNNNGFRDSKLIKGDNPAIVLAIDVSGSTAAPFVGPNGVDNVLEAQVAATKALVDSLVAQGLGDRINIGLIPHQANAVIQDMDPFTPGVQPYTTPNADKDNNGIPDIRQILDSYTPDGSNDFTKALQTIESLVSVLPGDPNVIFMSDGYGRLDEAIASNVVSNLSAQGIGVTAFGIGLYSTISTIQKIDPNAIQLTDVEELVDIFSGWDPRYAIEPLLENVTVYVDLNNNGVPDDGEPTQLTFKDDSESILGKTDYYYTFDNLLPGTYPVRIVVPNNATQTAPMAEVVVDNVTSAGGNFNHLFGLHFGGDDIPNSDPVFLTNPPLFALNAGESLIYKAIATDPDSDKVTIELVLAPEGMAVDSETGTLIWTPTALQVSEYYAELQANRERLEAIGRGDYAPTKVKFDVLLKASDGKGGQGLQYVEVELVPTNNAPVFTSIGSENLVPQVGKPFQYQAKAIDADGDEITYQIVSGLPSGAINSDTGLINWTPTSAQLGERTIIIKATDGQGGEALQTLTPVVIPARPNIAPTISSTPRTTARIGNVYLADLTVENSDGDPLSFSLKTAPTGMNIDSFGQISWLPTASDFGAHPVEVSVSDGQGGSDIVSFTLEVSDRASNRPPSIISVPDTVTNLERVYQYPLQGTDPDGDLLLWSLDKAPEGVVIDPNTGVLSWQPTSHQIGENAIAVRLTDGLGQFVGQEFTLSVTGINTPPEIVSTPGTIAAINRSYSYNVVGTDPENDPLSYSLGVHPNGMNIDAKTGSISWTPVGEQVGSNKVEVLVSDSQGGTSRQIYNLVVGTNAINRPPTITSNPPFIADIGSSYSYQVTASDPDGNSLTYQLLKKPAADMTINPITGEVTWDNPTLGNHQIVVGAVDSGGLGAAQGFTLIARENQQPVIDSTSVPSTTATPGVVYSYDVRAKDPDGGLVTFSLDEVSRSKGMTLDALGRLRWTPDVGDIGIHEIKVAIADDSGATIQQNFTINVAADTVVPKVSLIANYNFVNIGEPVTFQARATDNIKVEGLQLLINGNPVAIDSNGMATVSLDAAGVISGKAIATDAAGNEGVANISVQVIDASDTSGPLISLDLSDIADGIITSPTDIKGTVADSNLDYYKLEVAPIAGGEFTEIFRSSTPVENGVLGTFDPSVLQNDSYILRLTAVDKGGNISTTEEIVDVTGELKLGNFRLSFTDLVLPVSGIPITVTRTYDSLNANNSDNFGYGWRLEFRDTDLRTSVGRDELYEQTGIPSVGFKEGTRVYITLPGGKRTGFTFQPVIDPEIKKLMKMGARIPESLIFYNPAFKTDDGSYVTLSTDKTQLIYNSETGKYYSLDGSPYNPANIFFGGKYKLTTKEGIIYEIDALTGDLLTATDTNDNKLTFTDGGIFSSTGKSVTFERDVQGRITSVTDPEGQQVKYEYDVDGDLVAVRDCQDNTTKFIYDASDREHFLTEIIDPLGRTGVRSEYDESGRLKKMLDVNGEAVEMVYDPDNSTQTVLDVFGNPTTYVYDERGNIIVEVDAVGLVTRRTYNEDNNVLTETIVTEESGVEGWTTTYTYDPQGNQLSQTDPLGNTYRYTYNQFGQLLTSTDPLGNTTSYTFDSRGNVLSKTDAEGNTTTYTYDQVGNPLSINQGANDITRFEYDRFGNRIRKIDALGNETTFTYDPSGNVLTETQKLTTPDGVRNLITTKTYDAEGNVISELDAEGGLTQYEYDANGNQTVVIDAKGRRTEMRYDEKNNLIETILPDVTPDNLADNLRIKFDYDEAGNRTAITDPEGKTTLYEYNFLNQPTRIIFPDSTPNNPDDNPRISVEYNQVGEMTAMIDALGNRTEYEYDAATRMTLVRNALKEEIKISYDAAGREIQRTDAKGQTTSLKYDKLGQLVETIFPDGTSTKTSNDAFGNVIAETDREGRTTRFEYNALDQLVAIIDARQQRTEYQYDETGNLVSQKDANGHFTQFEYDGLGRPTVVIRPQLQRSETFYDPVGNVERTIDFNGETIEYNYDELNRLQTKRFLDEEREISYDYTPAGRVRTVTDKRGSTTFSYNERGLLDSRTEPDGTTISYAYNQGNLVEAVTLPSGTIEYRYDKLNRLNTVVGFNPSEVTTYQYDSVGNLETILLPNGVTETRGYDRLNRLTSLVNQDADGNVLSSYSYTLDKAGNKKTVEELGGRKVEYSYDELYRLTKEEITDPVYGNRTIQYAYDSVGNRLTRNDSVAGLTTYVYDDNDRLLTETTAGVTTAYSYDNNGNTTRVNVVGSSAETIYDWDGENRLLGATLIDSLGTTSSSQYRYDANGLRVASIVDGEETRYLLDASRPYAEVIEEYGLDGEIKASYVHGLDLISQHRDDNSLYYLQDGHSGVRQLSNGLGGVTDTYNYDAYGRLLQSTGTSDNNYLYRDEQFDPNVELQYLRARYYNQNNGRFLSVDPFEGLPTEPMSRHRYMYGNANPVTYTDPSGASAGVFGQQELTIALAMDSILNTITPYVIGSLTLAAILNDRLNNIWTGEIDLTLSDPAQDFWFVDILGVTGKAKARNGNTERTYDINALAFGVSFGARGLGDASGENLTRRQSLDFIVEVPFGARQLPPSELAGRFLMSQVGWIAPMAGANLSAFPILKQESAWLQIGPGRGFAANTNLATAESRWNWDNFVGWSRPTKKQPSNNTPSDS